MKKLLISIIFIIVLMTASAYFAYAEGSIIYEDTVGKVTYTVDSSGVMRISGTGKSEAYILPEDITANELIVEEGITEVDKITFADRHDLKKASFASSVAKISPSAFSSSMGLETVEFSEGLKEIGDKAFEYCHVSELVLPSSLEMIGTKAFYGSALKDVTIKSEKAEIGSYAFSKCGYLKTVNLPKKMGGIGNSAFKDSTIEKIVLPENLTKISNSAFSWCENLKEIKIPDSVKVIDNYAFYRCTSLETVQMGNSVVEIGRNTFYNCSSLKYIDIVSPLKKIDYCAFGSCYSLQEFEMPDTVTELGKRVFEQCYNMKSLRLSNSITEIPVELCIDCRALKEVNIPDGVTKIDARAFYHCSLNDIKIPESVTFIGNSALRNCSSAEYVSIPEKTELDEMAISDYDGTMYYVVKGSPAYKFVRNNDIPYTLRHEVSPEDFTLEYNSVTYTGERMKPLVTSESLVEGVDYSIKYVSNRKGGIAKVVVTGFDKACGTTELTYKINPKKAKAPTVTVGKDRVIVTMSKPASYYGGYRYQIKIREKGKGKWHIQEKVYTKKTFHGRIVNILKIEKGKKYEVKVRAYVRVGNEYVYGKWSDTKVTKKVK